MKEVGMEEVEDFDVHYETVGAAIAVHNALGSGHTKEVYLKALAVELDDRGIGHVFQAIEKVVYEDVKVGEVIVDLLVGDELAVEVVVRNEPLPPRERATALSYMRGTRINKKLLLNFGTRRLDFVRYPHVARDEDARKE